MDWSVWLQLMIVFIAGGIGGVVNALLTDNGFVMPRTESTGGGTITRPGFFGNILIGAVAATVSWGLYGPVSSVVAAGAAAPGAASTTPTLTVAALVGAIMVGVAGARWLTNEVDKNLLRATATQAAMAEKDGDLANAVALAPPAQALARARSAVQ